MGGLLDTRCVILIEEYIEISYIDWVLETELEPLLSIDWVFETKVVWRLAEKSGC
jgi:hypothetical protein